MKKLTLLLTLLFLFALCSSSYALITTENTDPDRFQYEVAYKFATGDLSGSTSAAEVPVVAFDKAGELYYVISRGGSDTVKGRVVGISVAGSAACTTGQATFDVTINGQPTGVTTVIETAARAAVGNTGSSGTTYAYMRHYRNDVAVEQGLNLGGRASDTAGYIGSTNPYGTATGLSAGDRIGVKVTTTSDYAPSTTGYILTVYVLE